MKFTVLSREVRGTETKMMTVEARSPSKAVDAAMIHLAIPVQIRILQGGYGYDSGWLHMASKYTYRNTTDPKLRMNKTATRRKR